MNVQASFTNFEYEQGSGPSNSQSFAINYEGLTDAIQINTVAPVPAMEFSLDSIGWSASIDTANTYSGTGTLTAYTRLKSGLSSSLYNGQFYVSFPQDGDAIPVNYNAAVKVPQQNVTIAGFYHPLRTFFGYPSASVYVSNPQEIVVNVKNPTFTSMSIIVTSSYELCVDRDPNTPFFFTSSISQSIITASGITNDYSLRFWMRLRSGSAGSVDTTLTVLDENNNTLVTASIAGRRYTGLSAIDCWNEATNIDVLWRNVGTELGLTYLGTFGGKYIYRTTAASSWTSARDFAASIGANLVTITSAAKQAFLNTVAGGSYSMGFFVSSFFPSVPPSLPVSFVDRFGRSWSWITGETSSYTNWLTNEPSDSILFNEPYGRFVSTGWIDAQNSDVTAVIESDQPLGNIIRLQSTAYSQVTTQSLNTLTRAAVENGFITLQDVRQVYERPVVAHQKLHARLVTPTTILSGSSPTTGSSASFPGDATTAIWSLRSTTVPTTPEFVTIKLQLLEPELLSYLEINSTAAGSTINSPIAVTGLNQFRYAPTFQLRGPQITAADIQTQKYLPALIGSTLTTDTSGSLDAIKLPKTVFTSNRAVRGKRDSYYYPNVYSKTNEFYPTVAANNTVYDERNFINTRLIDNIPQDGFIDATTQQITLTSIPLPETSDLSIYSNLKGLTLANLTGSLTTLYIPQNLTTLTISGSPVSYSINQEAPYSGALNTFNLGQSASLNITNYDTFISNLRFTTSSQFTLLNVASSSLPIIPTTVTSSIVGGGPFDEMNIRTFYTPGEPTMSILNVDGTGTTYTPGISMSFDTSVGDLKTVTITNMTASYDVDLSNLVSASVSITSGVRNVTLPRTYADNNKVITINSTNLENVYIPINANYSGSRNTTLGLIPGFSIDTLNLSGSFITNLTVSSSGYFNSFRRLLGGFETIRNYNFQFSSFDAGGVEYFLSQVSASGVKDFATSGSTTGSIVDNTKNWTTNQYIDSTIRVFDNIGNSYSDIITSNTTSSINFGRMVAGISDATHSIAYSDDYGLTWTKSTGKAVFSTFGWAVAWNGSRFVVGGDGSPNSILFSDDGGVGWSSTLPVMGQCRTIIWTGTRFIAGGTIGTGTRNNTLVYSADGIAWTGLGTGSFGGGVQGLAYNGSRIVAAGNGGNTLAYSDDGGLTWTGLGSTTLQNSGWGVAWNGTRWVAVGAGALHSIAHSTDGITWTGLGTSIFSSTGRAVAWNGTMFVAVGQGTNTIAYSYDGITWVGLGTSIFSSEGRSIAWNGRRWVAGAEGGSNTLAYSDDGINWVGLGTTAADSGVLGIGSTSPFASTIPNIGIAPSIGSQYAIIPDKTIDLRNQRNGLQITTAISSSKATLEGLGWTVNL